MGILRPANKQFRRAQFIRIHDVGLGHRVWSSLDQISGSTSRSTGHSLARRVQERTSGPIWGAVVRVLGIVSRVVRQSGLLREETSMGRDAQDRSLLPATVATRADEAQRADRFGLCECRRRASANSLGWGSQRSATTTMEGNEECHLVANAGVPPQPGQLQSSPGQSGAVTPRSAALGTGVTLGRKP